MRSNRVPKVKYDYLSVTNVTGGTTIEFTTKWERAYRVMWVCVGGCDKLRYENRFMGVHGDHLYIDKYKNFKR